MAGSWPDFKANILHSIIKNMVHSKRYGSISFIMNYIFNQQNEEYVAVPRRGVCSQPLYTPHSKSLSHMLFLNPPFPLHPTDRLEIQLKFGFGH